MFKYIFGAIFIALAWAAALVFRDVNFLFWGAVVVTVLVVMVLATLLIIRVLAAQRSAGKLDNVLSDQGGASTAGIRPDQRGEIAAMQAEFHRAISALKSSRLGSKGRSALGVLPWYVIIGPPGAGKTTALRSSGLQFPYAKGGKVKGVGGTRNCDWWFTNQAIILDTAGRWSTENEDKEEWLAFLGLLRKARPKKPLNGIILAISVQDLMGSDEELANLTKALRDRMDEVMGHLDMVVPVYFLLTKIDLLPGFIETFSDLRDKERGQLWGTTLPFMASPDERNEQCFVNLNELLDVISSRAAARMGEERRVDARFRIFEFPQQLASLKSNLTTLISELFAENVYQDAPILRGIYFTSGTQEGRTLDRVMQNMAAAFGIETEASIASVTRPKSYFLKEVFTTVIFPDQHAAIRSTRVLRRQRLQQIALIVVCFLAAAGSLLIPLRSYMDNSEYVKNVISFIEKLNSQKSGKDSAGLPTSVALESVETFSKNLSLEQTGRSVLFPREEVTKQIHVAIERLIIRPILRADLIQMTKPGGLGSTELLDALILHLLLTQEKQSDEPSPQSSRWAAATKLAGTKAMERWLARSSQSEQLPTSRAPNVVETLVQYYAQAFLDSSQMIDREKRFVNNARSALLGAGDDPLADIINDPTMPPGLRARDLLGSAVLLFSRDEPVGKKTFVVRGAFTPAGYEVVKHRLALLEKAQDEDEDSWILGKERKVRDARSIKRIKDNYFVQYITEWKRFLLSLTLQEPTSLDATRTLLKQLSTDKPFDFIWQNISQNLVLVDESIEDKALGMLKHAAGKKAGNSAGKKKLLKDIEGRLPKEEQESGPKQIAAAFDGLLRFGSVKPTGFEQYNQIINEVASALGPQGTPESKEFHRSVKTARTSLSNLIARYNDMGWEQGMLEKILMPPFRSAEVAVIGASADSANQKWCETVFIAYHQLLAGRYPFASGKYSTEAKIQDIEKFFQPGTGTLWQYYNDSLQTDIEKVGSVFRLREGAAFRYRDEFLRFLGHAQELTTRLFAKDQGKIGFPIAVHIHPSAQYSKIILDVGTKKIIGLNSVDRWEEFAWPIRRASIRLFVKLDEVETIGAVDEGDWSLFHLLARAIGTTKKGDTLTVMFPTANNQSRIQIDFKPENLRDLFNKFYLPRSITVGGGMCRK